MTDVVIEVKRSDLLDQRIDRYERIRRELSLPQIEVQSTSYHSQILFHISASPFDIENASEERFNLALGFLVRAERKWGENLAARASPKELGWDENRRVFSLHQCFFVEKKEEPSLGMLIAQRLNLAPQESFDALLMDLMLQDPRRAGSIRPEESSEEKVRWLLKQSDAELKAGRRSRSLQLLASAWRLRPSDLEIGERILRTGGASPVDEFADHIYEVLSNRPTWPNTLLIALARYARKTDRTQESKRWATKATKSKSMGSWKELVHVGKALDDRSLQLVALKAMADLGSEDALAILQPHLSDAEWRDLVEKFPGALTDRLFRWKCNVYARRERYRPLLALFYDNMDRAPLLNRKALEDIVDAANGVGSGGIQRLITQIRSPVWNEDASLEMRIVFAQLCIAQQQFEEAQRIFNEFPGLPSGIHLAALRGLGQWPRLYTVAASLQAEIFSVEAAFRMAFSKGVLMPEKDLMRIKKLSEPELEHLRYIAEQFLKTAADQPVVRQLNSALRDS